MKIAFFLRDITDCGGIQQTTCLNINKFVTCKQIEKVTTISLLHKYEDSFFDLDKSVIRIALFNRPVDARRDYEIIKRRLKNVLNNLDTDILIVQGTEYTCYLSRKIFKDFKVIVCEHHYFKLGKIFGLHWFGKKKALKKADAIVTLTEIDNKNYKDHLNRSISTRVIYNPLDSKITDNIYNAESKIIVSCGSLEKIKRFDHAIEMANIVLKKYTDWKWEIYGDGTEYKKLNAMIEKYDLSQRVILKGYEKNKTNIYSNKAMFVLTSKFEGFGMVLTEAMQYNLPLISYDVKYGPSEIIQNNINGYIIKDRDIDAFAKVIEELILDKEKRITISKTMNSFLEKYSLNNICNQWLELFNTLYEGEK